MLWVHPIIQVSAIILAWYVFYLGAQRFRSLHLHQGAVFKWRRHVALGGIAFAVLLAGIAGGMAMVYLHWQGFLMTRIHGVMGLIMVPFIVFGMGTGLYMNSRKKKRRILPLIHGLNNLIVLILAFVQAATGWGVVKTFVLGAL
ncbi:MAG: DUF4079 family protein [Thermodesulfobacteriota bacterium]